MSSNPETTDLEDMWCPDAAAYDRGECCGKCQEFVKQAEAYAAAMREASEWLLKVKQQ